MKFCEHGKVSRNGGLVFFCFGERSRQTKNLMQEANLEDVVAPKTITLVHGQVDRTYSVGTGAWSATSRKITSHSHVDAFKA